MKKTKILTILGVLLAMGLTACNKPAASSEAPASSEEPASVAPSSVAPSSVAPSSVAPSSSQAPVVVPDPDGHKFGADADVAADATEGTVAYKKAVCSDNDGATRLKINQSVVTYASGSSRKDGTPDGYTKLTSNNQSFSFKFKTDKKYVGKLYLYGCMDGWGSQSNHNASFYYGNNPNVEIKINGQVVDVSGSKGGSYAQWFGEDASAEDSSLSQEGYAPVGRIELQEGVNEVVYKRVQTLNMLIKDFVFVVFESEWGPATDVAADATAGTVAYKLYSNRFDSSKKIEVQLADSMLAEGSENKNDPAGYFKLKSNNQSFGFKFNYDSIAYGELFQRGVMDGWSSNKAKKLFSGGTNGADDFEIIINNEKLVVYPEQKAKSFEEAMPGEPDTEKNLSALTDVVTGAVVLKNGVNEFSYKRLASYNLALTHIVFIVENSDHAHAAGDNAAWLKDADYHWHTCGHEGCNFIVDKAAHKWIDDDSKQDVPSTCSVKGKHYVKCEVCGQTGEQELPLAAHTWGEPGTKINGATPYTCTVCSAKCYVLDFNDANSDGMHAPGKFSSGYASWNITGIEAGTYELYVSACTKSTSLGTQFGSRYFWNVDETKYEAASGTYGEYGFGSGEGTDYKWTTKSAASVVVSSTSALFKMSFQSTGYSAYFSAVRLVKVA